ncbi:DUF6056 family protein [Jatrophihabitans cynanchi]|uniref:DUF6056 family protein n=1 Tax=Jatrophihabitans cynanchi TaxID=2944128 RepID=A0ABY7JUJ7_9ACTN|nr:DUF6056 family protein [Jatrophihabitans sp. SB3-54]WAX56013.1 DUF6056 family protein [Jatrophihabitans sp. SB3-54]
MTARSAGQLKAPRSNPRATNLPWVPRWEAGLLATWFIVFAILAEFFPRTGDDWAWGTHEGTDRLSHFFSGINGRYGGDLTVLILVRAGLFAPLVVSAIVCATLFLVLQVSDNRSPLGYGLVGLLFLTMPLGTWRESVVWLSGFTNYAFAALAFLGLFALAKGEWSGRLRRPGAGRLALVALAGFVGQLFMENVTLSICVMGVGLSLLFRRVHGRWGPYVLTWTAAGFVGAAVMFSNSAYRTVARGGPAYQKTQVLSGKNGLHDLAVKLFDYISTHAVVLNVVLNATLVVLVVLLVIASGRFRTGAGQVIIVLSFAFLLLSWGLWLAERHRHLGTRTRSLAMLATLLLLAMLVLTALTLIRSRERRWSMGVAVASSVVLIGPLLFVNPIGPRCFYPTYLLLLVAVSVVAREVRERLSVVGRPEFSVPLHLASAAIVVLMFVVYVTISHALDRRLDHIHQAVDAGRDHVQISPLPYPYYVHNGDPFFSVLYERFKAYYGLPSDLVVQLVPNPWLRVPGKPPPLPAP